MSDGPEVAPRRSLRISSRTKVGGGSPSTGSKARNQSSATGGVKKNKEPKVPKKKTRHDDNLLSSPQSDGPINIKEILPSITLKNEKGEDICTSTIAAEKGVVLFLVPKADTPGCTMQACGFRDIWEQFNSLEYDVYAVSADAPTAQSKWKTKKQLPYPLISDPKRSLITILGAAEGNRTKRSHFVFEKGGKLLDKKMPVKPVDSPRLALEFVKGLHR